MACTQTVSPVITKFFAWGTCTNCISQNLGIEIQEVLDPGPLALSYRRSPSVKFTGHFREARGHKISSILRKLEKNELN